MQLKYDRVQHYRIITGYNCPKIDQLIMSFCMACCCANNILGTLYGSYTCIYLDCFFLDCIHCIDWYTVVYSCTLSIPDTMSIPSTLFIPGHDQVQGCAGLPSQHCWYWPSGYSRYCSPGYLVYGVISVLLMGPGSWPVGSR